MSRTAPIPLKGPEVPPLGARGAQTGFTLLELIVVIAIFAVFAVMAYGGLQAVLSTRRTVETAQDRLAVVQRAYIRLRQDLQQVRNRPIRDGYGDSQPALVADDNGYIEFTHDGWPDPLQRPRPSLERVAYRYEDGKLIRASWRVLDRAQDSKPVEAVLLTQVNDLHWQYMDAQSQWQSQWPPDSGNGTPASDQPPPRAVELTLRTQHFGELRFLFATGLDPGGVPASAAPAAGEGLQGENQDGITVDDAVPDPDPDAEINTPQRPVPVPNVPDVTAQ